MRAYVIELAICTGMKAPIPILGELRHYRSAVVGGPTTKALATKMMRGLCELNHGYVFSVLPALEGGAR